MKKALAATALILAACLALTGCAGDGQKPDDGQIVVSATLKDKPALVGDLPVRFPLVSEPETLRVLITAPAGVPQKDVFVWRTYEQMTGVSVDWTEVVRADRAETVHAALTNGTALDLILRCKLSATRLTQYGKSGLLLDLAADGLLKTYAPNCWAYLRSHPDTLASVMNPDGAIYALPQVNSGAELRVALKLFVNKQWLARVGMALPTTTDELRALLTAFREQDANGNGDPGDEIPFCSADWDSARYALYGAFGLSNRGYHNTTVDCDPATGETRWVEGCDAYRDFLSYMSGLYADGLLDKYAFSITSDQWQSNAAQDRIGVFASTNLAGLPADKLDNWVAIDQALEGPNGDKQWNAIRANFHSTGAAAIPATCRDPALVLRWLDYFWTDEGTLFYHMGVEGETFVSQPTGGYDYAPRFYEEMVAQNRSFDAEVSAYSPYPGGSNPTVEIAPYFMGGEMAAVPAEAARKLFAYGPTEYWPSFTFTVKENDALDAIRTDLEKFCDTAQRDFVTGARPLTEWDAYTAQLRQLRVAELLDIYQAAVDRYHALNVALAKNK